MLASGVAHDLNNILAVILAYSEKAMVNAPAGSRFRRDLQNVQAAVARGCALVESVLLFRRGEPVDRAPVAVEKIVGETIELVRSALPPDVRLEADLGAFGATVSGDETQIHRLVMNLATNGVQAMPAGGTLAISMHVRAVQAARPMAHGVVGRGSYVELRVADTGIGIAPEIVDRIFDPFFTTKDAGKGTGLGLSLVRGIVSELGGAIDVQSTPGRGTSFALYLPCNREAAPPATRQSAAGARIGEPTSR